MTQVLVIGIGTFSGAAASEAGASDPTPTPCVLTELKSVRPAVEALAAGLARTPGVQVRGMGAHHDLDLPAVRQQWREAHRSASGRVGEALVVHFTGHGLPGGPEHALYLATTDTDRGNFAWTALSVDEWLTQAESAPDGPPVLFMLDVCNAGRAVLQQWLHHLAARRRRAWVIAACGEDEKTYGARFTQATTVVLEKLQEGLLDMSPTVEHVPVETLAHEIDRELARSAVAEDRPAQTVLRTARAEAHVTVPPFFPNPSYRSTPGGRYRQSIENGLWQFAAALDPALDPVHFVSRASGAPLQQGAGQVCYFTGRRKQLAAIKNWMEDDGAGTLLVVTGSPGAGKSALLGVVTSLAHPQLREVSRPIAHVVPRALRPEQNPLLAAVHARQRGPAEVLASIGEQLGLGTPPGRTWTTEALVNAVAERRSAPVVLIVDALDEASLDSELLNDVLLPLSQAQRRQHSEEDEEARGEPLPLPPLFRVLIGTRPWWERYRTLALVLINATPDETLQKELRMILREIGVRAALKRVDRLIDLDAIPSKEREAEISEYLYEILDGSATYSGRGMAVSRQRTADVLSRGLAERHRQGGFLLVSLFAHHLLEQTAPVPVEELLQRIPNSLPEMLELHLGVLRQRHPVIPEVLAAVAHGRGQGMPLDIVHAVAQELKSTSGARSDLLTTRKALQAASFYLRFATEDDGRQLYRFFHQSLVDHLRDRSFDAGRAVFTGVVETVPGPEDLAERNWKSALPYVLRHAPEHAATAEELDALLSSPSFLVHGDARLLRETLPAASSLRGRVLARICDSALSGRQTPATRIQWLRDTAVVWQEERFVRQLDALWEPPRSTVEFRWGTADRPPAWGMLPRERNHIALARCENRWIAVIAGEQGELTVWDVRTGGWLDSYSGTERDEVTDLCVMETGSRTVAAMGSADGTVIVWDLVSGTEKLRFQADIGTPVTSLSLGRIDGRTMVVAATPSGVTVRDLDGVVLSTTDFIDEWLRRTAPCDSRGSAWEASSPLAYACHAVSCVDDRDGPAIVAGTEEGRLHMWSLRGDDHRSWQGHTGALRQVVVHNGRSGPVAVTRGSKGLEYWDLEAGTSRPLPGPGYPVQRIAALREGLLGHAELCVLTSGDSGQLCVQRAADGTVLERLSPFGASAPLVVALDGSGSAAAVDRGEEGVTLWYQTAPARLFEFQTWRGHDSPVEHVASLSSGSGHYAITIDEEGHFHTWDVAGGVPLASGHVRSVRAVTALVLEGEPVAVLAAGLGPARNRLVVGLLDGRVRRIGTWHSDVLTLDAQNPTGPPVLSVRTSTYFGRIDLRGERRPVAWRPAPGEEHPSCTAWSGARLVIGFGSGLLALHSESRSRKLALHEAAVTAVTSLSVDGRHLVVFGDENGMVVVLDRDSRTKLAGFVAHSGEVVSTHALRRNGAAHLVTSSTDGTVKVWSLDRPGLLLHSIQVPDVLGPVRVCDAGMVVAHGSRVSCYGWTNLPVIGDGASL
ncbi:AAA family ATPase [Streptomyces sp. NPDC007991]|uniref:AAA family ATPase n=1 Tax=Streptomyces sp. NPDC007991 TaxID=3364803 RepID=UPI0036E1F7AA